VNRSFASAYPSLNDNQKKALKRDFSESFIKMEDRLSTPNLISSLKATREKLVKKMSTAKGSSKDQIVYVLELIDEKINEPSNSTFKAPN
jgi:hypothetical protein